MTRIPFRVSARAARLIGRENVATSQGAVTELVKNAYDADALTCVILFLPKYPSAPATLQVRELDYLAKSHPLIKTYFDVSGGAAHLRADISPDQELIVAKAVADLVDLWIIDNGQGMSKALIEKHWMVIGTDTKELNAKSVGGRTVTGAKGIGRFALDRLGAECELYSAPKGGDLAHWLVDWGDFEGQGKIIDDVTAVLEEKPGSLPAILADHKVLPLLPKELSKNTKNPESLKFSSGTAIRISQLNDLWDSRDSIRLKDTLEALLPPKDQGDFNIYVFDHRLQEQNGWIDTFPPDQFDYRLRAVVKPDGDIAITLHRQEIDQARIRARTFTLPSMNRDGYREANFKSGEYSYSKSLAILMKTEDKQQLLDLAGIGPFEFTLYFFKLANPTRDVLERYPQKSFDATKRRRWLSSSGGIRLYRDDFRVRPYGEPNTQGSDWLLLGQRNAANPAAVSRMGWRVPPQQVAGTIHITKEKNPLLADQSNREGIMNERAFSLFRSIVLALITEFERDRSYIYGAFEEAYNLDNPTEQKMRAGTAVAKKILSNRLAGPKSPDPKHKPQNKSVSAIDVASAAESETVAEALDISVRRNAQLQEELQVLRGMATLGTVLVSFTHELKQIKANMSSRQTRMENALNRVVDSNLVQAVPEQVNPFQILKRWGREDEKVSRWVDFALATVSPSKRRRQNIDIHQYLGDLKDYWKEFLEGKKSSMVVALSNTGPTNVLAHEIDLDSIFYNLVINSVEAFTRPSSPQQRLISISTQSNSANSVLIKYQDTGPGLSNVFKYPDYIFQFGSTSKAEQDTEGVSGTGIGMWLLKSIVDDFGGAVAVTTGIGEAGFAIEITLPTK